MIRPGDLADRSVRHGWIRRRGRPRVFDGEVQRVDVRLPAPVYDALCRRARETDTSVYEVIRRVLTEQVS